MKKIIDWIKNNKVITILVLVVLFLLFKGNLRVSPLRTSKNIGYSDVSMGAMAPTMERAVTNSFTSNSVESAPSPTQSDRKVIGNYNMSALVKEAKPFMDNVSKKVTEVGGFVVSSSLTSPESTVSKGYLSVRVPTDQLDGLKSFIQDGSIRIVSESQSARDVTDQYYDVETRLNILRATKLKYEGIMEDAVKIDDILRVQREIINLQSQIEQVQGQKKYLDATTSTVLLAINFSTDELELPYAPVNKFRPDAVLKLAVRGLLGTLASIGTKLIWIAVYSVIWIPLLLIYKGWRMYRKSKKPKV